jgi:hypothetical protein
LGASSMGLSSVWAMPLVPDAVLPRLCFPVLCCCPHSWAFIFRRHRGCIYGGLYPGPTGGAFCGPLFSSLVFSWPCTLGHIPAFALGFISRLFFRGLYSGPIGGSENGGGNFRAEWGEKTGSRFCKSTPGVCFSMPLRGHTGPYTGLLFWVVKLPYVSLFPFVFSSGKIAVL